MGGVKDFMQLGGQANAQPQPSTPENQLMRLMKGHPPGGGPFSGGFNPMGGQPQGWSLFGQVLGMGSQDLRRRMMGPPQGGMGGFFGQGTPNPQQSMPNFGGGMQTRPGFDQLRGFMFGQGSPQPNQQTLQPQGMSGGQGSREEMLRRLMAMGRM